MPRRLIFYFLLISLSGCAHLDEFFSEPQGSIDFKGKYNNQYFKYQSIMYQNLALLPIRSSFGGGGDKRMTEILVRRIKEKMTGVYLISDDLADKFFTENDIWDDYFSFVSSHAAKGLSTDIDEMFELYSMLNVTTVFSVTSDFRFSGVEGLYPRNINAFASLQIFDFRSCRVIWDGLVDAQDVLLSKEEEDQVIKRTFKRVAERLINEILRQ